jgi:hypothetical protein
MFVRSISYSQRTQRPYEDRTYAARLEFRGLGRRVVVGKIDGDRIRSDSGGLLLRAVERRAHILKRLAGGSLDYRDPDRIEHTMESVIKQRVTGLALRKKTSTITIPCARPRCSMRP